MNQPQLVTNVPIRRGVGGAGFRRKVPGINLITQSKHSFSITSDSKGNITFSKGTNSKHPKSDPSHICGKKTDNTTTES